MSSRHKLHDSTGVISCDGLQQTITMTGITTDLPADGGSGHNPGALFFNTQTGAWYVNTGSVTSCAFKLTKNVVPTLAKLTSFATSAGATAAAGDLTGASNVTYKHITTANPGTFTTRTATQMFTDAAVFAVGDSYVLRIVNAQGTGTLTLGAGSGVTLTGTMTVAVNTFRDFVVTFTSATALTIESVAVGTYS